jgi:calnexin
MDNPLYKGEWKPQQIPNPDFFEDLRPADVTPIGGVAIEVWTTNGGFHFDNFVLGYNLDDAFRFADQTFVIKAKAEAEQNKNELAEQRKQVREQKLAEGGFVNTFQVYVAEAFEFLSEQPPLAVGIAVLLIFLSIFFMIPASKPSPEEVESSSTHEEAPKKAAEKTTEKVTTEQSEGSQNKEEVEEEEEEIPSKGKRRPKKVE